MECHPECVRINLSACTKWNSIKKKCDGSLDPKDVDPEYVEIEVDGKMEQKPS
jgi:hypothetical protein